MLLNSSVQSGEVLPEILKKELSSVDPPSQSFSTDQAYRMVQPEKTEMMLNDVATGQTRTKSLDNMALPIKREVQYDAADLSLSRIEIADEPSLRPVKSEGISREYISLNNFPVGVGTASNHSADDMMALPIKKEFQDDAADLSLSRIEITDEPYLRPVKSEGISGEYISLNNFPVGEGTASNHSAQSLQKSEEVVGETMTNLSSGIIKEELHSNEPFSLNASTNLADHLIGFMPVPKNSFDVVAIHIKEEVQDRKNDLADLLHTSIDIKPTCLHVNEPHGLRTELQSSSKGFTVAKKKRGRLIKSEAEKKAKKAEYESLRYLAKKNSRDSHLAEKSEFSDEVVRTTKRYDRLTKSEAEKKSRKAKYDMLRYAAKIETRKSILVHAVQEPFRCDHCPASFKSKSGLEKHMSVHSHEKPFRCNKCSKSFKRKDYLKSHSSVHKRKKPFSCSQCSASFKENTYLKKHMLIHAGEKRFRCDHCSVLFRQKTHLRDHMMVHSDEKPFRCCQCSASFKDNTYLKKHMLIHTDEKPFRCDYCFASFKRKRHVKIHMSVHTDEKPFHCDFCSASFKCKQTSKKHMMKHSVEKPFSFDLLLLKKSCEAPLERTRRGKAI